MAGFRYFTLLFLVWMCASCAGPEPTVEFYLSEGYRFSPGERRVIESIARATVLEARRALQPLPRDLVVRVYAGQDVIPETGETGTALRPATVIWVVDPDYQGGVLAVARTWLRASLLHEFHHLARLQTMTSTSLMDDVITEGLATAFERDVAGVSPEWGVYPENVQEWVSELLVLPPGADRNLWLRGRHPDGRRWIGMRAGTYLADQAMARSGKSAGELVLVSTDELLELATSGVRLQ